MTGEGQSMDEDKQKELITILKDTQLSFLIMGEGLSMDEDARERILTWLSDLKKMILVRIITEISTNPQTQPYLLEESLQLCNDLIRRTREQGSSTSTAGGASSSHATSRASSSGIADISSSRRSSTVAGIGGSSSVKVRKPKFRVEGCVSCIQPRQGSVAEASWRIIDNVEIATETAGGIWVFRGTDEEFESVIADIRNLFGKEAVLCALSVVNGNDEDFEYIVEYIPKFVDPFPSAEHEEFEDIIVDIRTLFEDEPVVYGFVTFRGTEEDFKDIIADLRIFYKEEHLLCLLAVFGEDDEEEFEKFTADLRIFPKKEDGESTFEDITRENRFVHCQKPGLVCVDELDEKILRVRSCSGIGDWLSKYSHLLDCYDEYDAFKGLNGRNKVVEKEFEASEAAIEAFKIQKKRDQSARLQGLKRKFNMIMNVCKKRRLKSKEQSGEEKFELMQKKNIQQTKPLKL